MHHAILVTWDGENGEKLWHICRGYTDYDAFTAYTMFCKHQTSEEFFETHKTERLGSEIL